MQVTVRPNEKKLLLLLVTLTVYSQRKLEKVGAFAVSGQFTQFRESLHGFLYCINIYIYIYLCPLRPQDRPIINFKGLSVGSARTG